ncbi:unknown (plasmid) [Haloarcula marismortui ATCC 43049]|uniref:Uncharacterized protein n=1 Tax=Haloarcula marismortui (strain ATCC 43049 / DSM 3752 / JCM 8966 / VKM B-1809) TaxID=272569 RepID=Q5V871_HALMA|nr:hypothetical protein [Haloarcula marismortui]AAV44270.1 unknown [Haloarcula marismortui ATCC 43049]QCP89419.1 hypothetical protein E6P14_00355 [Haloarcula marismortui ATCC 43049]
MFFAVLSLLVALVAGSFIILQRFGEFTAVRWSAIVGVNCVVALQTLSGGTLLKTVVTPDVFVLVLVVAGYAVVQLMQGDPV